MACESIIILDDGLVNFSRKISTRSNEDGLKKRARQCQFQQIVMLLRLKSKTFFDATAKLALQICVTQKGADIAKMGYHVFQSAKDAEGKSFQT